jgi:hypothetical protein
MFMLGLNACNSKDNASLQTTSATDYPTTMPTITTPTSAMTMPKTTTTASVVVNSLKTSADTVTITGYITTEDDFAAGLGADTAGMINMKMMAMSGLGITRKMDDGKWEFYYFDGNISTGGSINGKWVFDGTGAQLNAWNIVLAIAAKNPDDSVPVTVMGVIKGDTMTNPGMDTDGLNFPVVTVSSIKGEALLTTGTTKTVVNSLKTSPIPVTISGYVTTEDDFVAGLGADTSGMINMKMMAMSGLGITRKMDDSTWEFYYFDGAFSGGGQVNGNWVFSGSGAQQDAWRFVTAVANISPDASVPVTVTGVINGDTMTNPGMDADGVYYPVLTVTSIISAAPTPVTIKGYITTEDDFVAKLGADTSAMIHMRMMAASGLGVTRQKADGTWEFYYISGTISGSDKVNGVWTFNGSGAQLDAWNLVTAIAASTPTAPVPVMITGTLSGNIQTNPGMDKDGLYFPVIMVTSIALR